MEVYIARQPIYDRNMNVYGYELLYRKSINNYYEGTDDTQSTAELIENSFLIMNLKELTTGSKAFINFSATLIEKDIPQLLPKKSIVIELLERVVPTESILEKCKQLRKKGYILALDDFVLSKEYLPFVEIADIIKIEVGSMTNEAQKNLIDKYKKNTKFLAEKVETIEQYNITKKMGYCYFQGYLFSKPIMVKSEEIGSLNTTLVRLLSEVSKEELDYQVIANIIESDLNLTYKMMKIANSLHYFTKNKIKSIKHALAMFGTKEIKKWIYLMMLRETQNIQNRELIKNCLIRGKLMECIAVQLNRENEKMEYFITGLFSSIDVILNKNMKDIIAKLPFSISIKNALLGKKNKVGTTLEKVINYENLNWENLSKTEFFNISKEMFMEIYVKALKWYMALEY